MYQFSDPTREVYYNYMILQTNGPAKLAGWNQTAVHTRERSVCECVYKKKKEGGGGGGRVVLICCEARRRS